MKTKEILTIWSCLTKLFLKNRDFELVLSQCNDWRTFARTSLRNQTKIARWSLENHFHGERKLLKKNLNAECPEDCIFDNYHVSSSTTQLDLGDHDDMHLDEKHNDHIIHSAIHFYYSSFTFTIIKNHPESLVKWLSNSLNCCQLIFNTNKVIIHLFYFKIGDVGGNMSLYLGASFVTLLEMIVLLFRCSRKCVSRKTYKQDLLTQSFYSTWRKSDARIGERRENV